jgi:hypothetical protein
VKVPVFMAMLAAVPNVDFIGGIARQHPAHAADWADPAIDVAYDDVWQLLMDGLCVEEPRLERSADGRLGQNLR